MDWEFDEAPDGNIALTGELDLQGRREFTLCLAFGQSLSSAATALFDSLAIPFEEHKKRFIEQWERPGLHRLPLEKFSGDGGNLYHSSYSLLLAHEDKTYPGAFIASLSIPWGESRGDNDEGGYHYIWTRDMVNTATGLLAAGNTVAPLRALIYLATIQHDDGRFPQNFWIDGTAYWGGNQLDEVAFPILLAWRLYRENALADFDPYHLIKRGAGYLRPARRQRRHKRDGRIPADILHRQWRHVSLLLYAQHVFCGNVENPILQIFWKRMPTSLSAIFVSGW